MRKTLWHLRPPQIALGNGNLLLEEHEVCGALKVTMVTTKPKPSSTADWTDATPTLDTNGMTKKEACPLLGVDTISLSSSTHELWCSDITRNTQEAKENPN